MRFFPQVEIKEICHNIYDKIIFYCLNRNIMSTYFILCRIFLIATTRWFRYLVAPYLLEAALDPNCWAYL